MGLRRVDIIYLLWVAFLGYMVACAWILLFDAGFSGLFLGFCVALAGRWVAGC